MTIYIESKIEPIMKHLQIAILGLVDLIGPTQFNPMLRSCDPKEISGAEEILILGLFMQVKQNGFPTVAPGSGGGFDLEAPEIRGAGGKKQTCGVPFNCHF